MTFHFDPLKVGLIIYVVLIMTSAISFNRVTVCIAFLLSMCSLRFTWGG